MSIYLVVAVLTAIFSELSVKLRNKTIRKLSFLVAIIVPSFLYAVRYGIGTDYFNYASAFNRLQIIGFEGRFEWAYVLLNILVGRLGGSLELLFFIIAIIMFSFLYLSLKEYSNSISIGIGMLAYMLLFYQMSFNMVRHSVAMAICLFSVKYIQERKFWKFIMIIILASGFHNSALILIPAYVIHGQLNKQIPRMIIYFVSVVSVISIDKLIKPVLEKIPQFNYYLVYLQNDSGDFTFNYLIRHAPFILIGIMLYRFIKKYDRRYSFVYSLYVISLIMKLSGLIGAEYLNRISLNFEVVLILLVGYYVKYLNKTKHYFASVLIVIYLLIYWYYLYIFTGSHGTYPYKTILGLVFK
ncbi:MAG: EpsG family protein [Tissierella sp.]|uniref:EpsG family protein n=1 Tax=Tissierella sp. TaxID=41274 RepID=UPI003F9CDAEB